MDTQSIVTSNMGVVRIGRPHGETHKDPTVNYRDRLNDILSTEKHGLVTYQTAINEAINDDLRNMLIDLRNKIQGTHVWIFNELFERGDYQADAATHAQVKDVSHMFNNYKSQLPMNY